MSVFWAFAVHWTTGNGMVSGQLASHNLDTSRAQTRLQPALENPKAHIYPRRKTFDTPFRDLQPRPRIFADHADDTPTTPNGGISFARNG